MDIAGKARKLERKIARSVEAVVGEFAGRPAPEPLEIVHAVVDRAEQQVQEAGRGRRVFPFNRVKVHLLVSPQDKGARARFAAVADGPPTLAERLQSKLQSAGCRSEALEVEIAYTARAGANWENPEFHVEFARLPAAPPPVAAAPAPPARLKLLVLNGKAARRAYAFTGGRIDIGRRAEVIDARQRIVRTNDVAFDEEGPDANRTVSRRHAHVIYQEGSGEYRLWDDRSAHGTSLVRRGRTIPVPGASRGVRLEPDDEIVLGQARLKVVIE